MSGITEQKLEDFRRVFDLFDQNKDGTISCQELGQVMQALGLNPTKQEIAEIMLEVDQNGNQRLDFSEFVKFMENHWQERDQETELREAFRIFDRDNSGSITIGELKQVMLNMGERLTEEELAEMMKEADVDKDGKLDYAEFTQKLLSNS